MDCQWNYTWFVWGCNDIANIFIWKILHLYGGVFIVIALICAWKIDIFKPDKHDLIGTVIIIIDMGSKQLCL